MRIASLVYGSVAAIAMAVTMSTVSAADQSSTQDRKAAPASVVAKSEKAPVAKFATLKDVKAVPMAARELDAVKGLHIHFTTPGGFHLVNHTENNLGNGNAPAGSGPGYSGLCGAALKSPALTIPGQNPATGIGGGC